MEKSHINLHPCEVWYVLGCKSCEPFALSDYRICVKIEDGRQGLFDMKPCLDRGLFRELNDVNYFNQVGILLGAVTWPHGQDIAPETLIGDMVPVETMPDNALHTDASC